MFFPVTSTYAIHSPANKIFIEIVDYDDAT